MTEAVESLGVTRGLDARSRSHWCVAAASVPGLYSKSGAKPLQDACRVWTEGEWGVAVLADGAGSLTHSHIGAQLIVDVLTDDLLTTVETNGWQRCVPEEGRWRGAVTQSIHLLRADLAKRADESALEFASLGATVIALVFSTNGALTAHIGDGRAAVRSRGRWDSAMVPFKGDEVGATVFVTSDICSGDARAIDPTYLETRVIDQPIDGFVLMSDGCERAAFSCYLKDEASGVYRDPNEPYAPFLEHNRAAILAAARAGSSRSDIDRRWADFLDRGSPSLAALRDQADDKTMILGCVLSDEELA